MLAPLRAARAALRVVPLPLQQAAIPLPRSIAARGTCRWFASNASDSTRASATLTPAQRLEQELSLSNARRLERARRLEELRELEAQLHAHRIEETGSLRFGLSRHWATYGPILAAVIASTASLVAAYHLWQQALHHGEKKTALQTELGSARASLEALDRRAQVELQDAQRVLAGYLASKTALVSAPADVASPAAASGGWLWRSSTSKISTPAAAASIDAAAAASSPVAGAAAPPAQQPLVTRTLRATKAELAKLEALQGDLQRAYAASA